MGEGSDQGEVGIGAGVACVCVQGVLGWVPGRERGREEGLVRWQLLIGGKEGER